MGSISHIRLRERIFFSGISSSQFLLGFFACQKFGWFSFWFLFCFGVIEEEIDYARYATFATIATLRYATDRRGQKEERRGFFCWCRIERERERERRRKRREKTNAIYLRRGDCPQKTEKSTIPKSETPKGKEEEEEADMETIASCFETTAITSYLGQSLPNRPLTNRKAKKRQKI